MSMRARAPGGGPEPRYTRRQKAADTINEATGGPGATLSERAGAVTAVTGMVGVPAYLLADLLLLGDDDEE